MAVEPPKEIAEEYFTIKANHLKEWGAKS